ncbi:nuclear transport factor 2 family protein [Streptomyces sp. FXJ1.4098]|uniref:nuclear transport factor 2 family protein n=1 Tax=Streptomyces sp. NPDC020845 TaxID=3365096 RepID=UPI002995C02C|nr:nuclear transport factor 2 family protein [Streptomyces sp. FXJ1.4098]
MTAIPRPIDLTDVPEVVTRHLHAHDTHDIPAVAATLTPEASITDDGHTYEGIDAITGWLEQIRTEFTYTTTPVAAEHTGVGQYTVTQHLEGDFPGGSVDLRYRFTLDEGLIRRLVIAP